MGLQLRRADGLTIADDRSMLEIDRICAWLAESYWAHDRDRPTIERSLANSYPYGVYRPSGEQIALARATTDLASFAWLGDVVVDADWRGRGIGSWLVRTVVDHLAGLGVPRFALTTRDAHGVYEPIGFGSLRVPETWMEIDVRTVRPNHDDVRLPR
ncbi:MAG: histone acetyltransferase and related acetyltransferase [Pseudonocardiales bacterium]|nr:histone acetyltransferase and related acetyltransferase [Pseudonocardiales bacterium]